MLPANRAAATAFAMLLALWGLVLLVVGLPSAGASNTYSGEVLAHGPLAYWRLGQASGTLLDSSGNAHGCTPVTPVTYGVTGAINEDTDKAVTFSGNGHADCGNPSAFQRADVSIAGWVKGTGTSAYLFGKAGAYMLYSSAAGKLCATDNAGGREVCTTTTVNDNAWHFVALTLGGSNAANNARFYVDGSNVLTDQIWPNLNTAPFVLGAAINGSTSAHWNGSLDEVAIFGKVLSDAEISALYTTAGASSPTTTTTVPPTTTTTVPPTTTTTVPPTTTTTVPPTTTTTGPTSNVLVGDESSTAVLLGIGGLVGGLAVGSRLFGSWL